MQKDTIDSEFEEICKHIGGAYGLDDISSKVFAILYLEPDEISLESLAEKTGYSLSTVSKCISNLERAPFFKKYRKPKSKKIYCVIEKDFEKMTLVMMKGLLYDKIIPFREKVPLIIEKYDIKNAGDVTKQKIQTLKNALIQTKRCEKAIQGALKAMEEK